VVLPKSMASIDEPLRLNVCLETGGQRKASFRAHSSLSSLLMWGSLLFEAIAKSESLMALDTEMEQHYVRVSGRDG
jgi:hypothetical protein